MMVAAWSKGDSEPKSDGGETAVTVPAVSPGGTATTIHLVVQGGEHAGTYDARSSDVTCSYGFASLEGTIDCHQMMRGE